MSSGPRRLSDGPLLGLRVRDVAEICLMLPYRKSLVRVKIGTLFLIFMTCWLFLEFISDQTVVVFALAMIASVLSWFVWCERCKSSLYYRADGTRLPSYGLRFIIASQCPHIGLERL